MKDQYFADRRDFVKYDLLLDLVQQIPSCGRLLSILMLTPDDGTAEGGVVNYEQGFRRPELFEFLKRCIAAGTRRVSLLRDFMREAGVEYLPYRDDVYFTNAARETYFAECIRLAREHSLIFFDPDVGLETGTRSYMLSRGLDKYLLHAELANVAQAAPRESVFVVYQHLQKDKRRVFDDLDKKRRSLCAFVGSSQSAFITDLEVAFLITSGDSNTCESAIGVVSAHATRHGLQYGNVGV